MTAFMALLKMNIRRRLCDGFAIGYNIIFPVLMIGLLGVLCRNFSYGGITSYQYYTVVMIPFCIVMAIITAAYAGKDDAYAKTAQRVLMTPVSVKAIVLVKVISCTLAVFLCSMVVYAVSSTLVGLATTSICLVGLLFLALSFAVAALGTMIGLGMKNFLVLKNVINIPIALFAILGGTFFRIGTFHKVGNCVLSLSPLRWINKSLFMLLYDGNSMLLWQISAVLMAFGVVCTLLAIVVFQKGEYMNGDLPSYDE